MLSVRDIAHEHVADMAQQAASRIAMKMAADIDAVLTEVIKDYLGIKELDVDSVPGVLRKRMFAAHMPDGVVEYRIDGHPILRLGPMRVDLSDGVLHATRDA